MKLYTLLIIVFLLTQTLLASPEKDSLNNIVKEHPNDTIGINAYIELFNLSKKDTAQARGYLVEGLKIAKKVNNYIWTATLYGYLTIHHYKLGEYDKSIYYNKLSLELRLKNDDKKEAAKNMNNLGVIYDKLGKFNDALDYLNQAIEVHTENQDTINIIKTWNNIGNVFIDLGNYPKTLEAYFNGLKLSQIIKDKNSEAKLLGNIGNLYNKQSEYEKALEYHKKSLKIKEQLEKIRGISASHNNLGFTYEKLEQYDKSLHHYQKSLDIKKEIGTSGQGITLNNIASVQCTLKRYESALENGLKAYELNSNGFKEGEAISANVIGICYMNLQKYKLAKEHLEISYQISKEIEYPEGQMNALYVLYELYNKQKMQKEALNYYILYTEIKDKIFNNENNKKLGKIEASHEFEMAALKKQQEEAERQRIENERIYRRNLIQNIGIFCVILLLLTGLLFSGLIQLPEKVIEAGIFFIFLLIFEFLLIFAGPYADSYANGQPAILLFINALIALIITPFHNFFEKSLRNKLIINQD